jgi:hypothetical protein
MSRILKKHFDLIISSTRVKDWLNRIEEGDLTYERPSEETG